MPEDMSWRLRNPAPVSELERRWSAVRKLMAQEGIDCLIAQNTNPHLGGYVRWFIDVPCQNGYATTVVFPVDDEMTTITHGSKVNPAGPPPWIPASVGIKRRLASNFFRSVHYTDTYDAEQAVEDLKARGAKKVGWVGKGSISSAFYEYVLANLPGVEFVNASELVDTVMIPKSEWELEMIRQAAALQDRAMAHIVDWVKPGKNEHDMYAELWNVLYQWGSEAGLLLIGSAPAGQPAVQQSSFFQNRVLQPGDAITLLIEVNGPSGLYTELARSISLGTPGDDLLKASADALEAMDITVKRLVPGAKCPEIIKAHNEFMVATGYAPETRIYSHGQGYSLVERPLIREDEPMVIQETMNITVHPFVANSRAFINYTDNFIVTRTGAEHIHNTPMEILVARG